MKYQADGSLIVTQIKYIRDLLFKVNIEEANEVYSPMLSHCKPNKFGSDSMWDSFLYRSVVGVVQYVTLIRQDITYYMNKDCQFMDNPLDSQ